MRHPDFKCETGLLVVAIAFVLLPTLSSGADKVIDLSKPVSESLTPDRLYWALDGGTIGEPVPEVVEDLSGNFFEGKLMAGEKRPQPTYVEGRFGTAIHLQGMTPRETTETGALRTFANPSVQWSIASPVPSTDPELLDLDHLNFTIGLWVKVAETNHDGTQQYITLLHRGRSQGWIFMLIKTPGELWSMRFSGAISKDTTDAFNDEQWHHVGVSVEKVEGGNLVTFWLDGEHLGEPVLWAGEIETPTGDGNRCLSLGETTVANYPNGMVGAYDDVFITSGVHEFRKP